MNPAARAVAYVRALHSVTQPSVVGTASTVGAVWAALLHQVADTGQALGVAAASPQQWAAQLGTARPGPGRALDDYVEAVRDPRRWSAFGTTGEVLQLVKYLWHILVLRGAPATLRSTP